MGIAGFLIWAFLEGRGERSIEQEREQPIKAPSRMMVQNGETVIHVDTVTQAKGGIVLGSPTLTSYQREIKAYGTVLQLTEFFELRNQYVQARAYLKKLQVSLVATRREYERLKILNEANKNASDKALQTAETAWRSNEAEIRAAQEAIRILKGKAQQQWGDVLEQWLVRRYPSLNRLIQYKDVLIQITLPAGTYIPLIPETAKIQVQDTLFVTANLVSPAPRTDPRIQGVSFFYITPAKTMCILPGMNVLAYLPVGPQVQGIVIPSSAVVWWQGKAWVYQQKDPEYFIRQEILTENPVENGWFLATGFTPEDHIIVSGAQLLLSEEFRTRIEVGEEGERR